MRDLTSSVPENGYLVPLRWADWVFSALFAAENLLITALVFYVWTTSTPIGYGGASIIGGGIVCFYAPLVLSFLFHQPRLLFARRQGERDVESRYGDTDPFLPYFIRHETISEQSSNDDLSRRPPMRKRILVLMVALVLAGCANQSRQSPFPSALPAMERADLINSDTRIDVRPLVSTARGELSKTLTLPEEALQERRRWVEERGFSVGDVMAANACYGISGPPPPNVSVSEWKHRFPAHCRSGSKPETVAFGTVKHRRNPCPDDDPIRLRSRDDASDDPDERRWVLAAVKVSGHNWTRYDLSMHFDAIAETWRVDSISTCLSVSA